MPSTYTPIARVNIAAGDTGVNFTSIPQTYTDLIVVLSLFNSSVNTGTGVWFRLNSDGSAIYSATELLGNGSVTTSSRVTSNTIWAGNTALTVGFPSDYIFQINNYSNTNVFKSAMWKILQPGTDNRISLNAGLYRSTSAVTAFNVLIPGGNSQLSRGTASLYGIKAA
jgi:hypothetical protein